MKKLLIVLVSILLLVGIVVSAVNLVPTLLMIDWGDVQEHFTKDEERFALSLSVSEGGRVTGAEPDYVGGTLINLLAVPDEGYLFAGWYTAEDTYLTTAKTYSFAIEADTVLKAEFVPRPQDMNALYESYQELFNCSQNFSFSVFCDREDAAEYLANNLTINDVALLGTEYEEFGAVGFTVEQVGDTNEFRIVVADDTYQPGATYTATLPAPTTEEGQQPQPVEEPVFVDTVPEPESTNVPKKTLPKQYNEKELRHFNRQVHNHGGDDDDDEGGLAG